LAFARLVSLIPRDGQLLLCADNAEAAGLAVSAKCAVETFGLAASADWRADNICHQSASTTFEVVHGSQSVGSVNLPLLGVFNIRNALGSIAAAVRVGASVSDVLKALEGFCGVRRRLELRGVARGVAVYDDFAHHPTAVRETLEGLRAAAVARRIWAVFEPRSATACRKVFQSEFVDALQLADEVIVADVYRTALPDAERLSEGELVARLSKRGVSARHVSGVDSIISLLSSEARDGDLVVIMSNGDFEGIHGRVLSRLAASV